MLLAQRASGWREQCREGTGHHCIGPNRVRCHSHRTGGTELPGLTSDPVVYGVPQGRNPHLFFRTLAYAGTGNKPIVGASGSWTELNDPQSRCVLCAFHPSALNDLRASDSGHPFRRSGTGVAAGCVRRHVHYNRMPR